MGIKIKDKYGVNEIKLNNDSTSLEIWFNKMINKTEDELEISDLLRMIRQNLFMDLALNLSIEMLKQNPFIGEYYEGELINHLLRIDVNLIIRYKDDIKQILSDAQINICKIVWESEDDKDEFNKNLQALCKIIKLDI